MCTAILDEINWLVTTIYSSWISPEQLPHSAYSMHSPSQMQIFIVLMQEQSSLQSFYNTISNALINNNYTVFQKKWYQNRNHNNYIKSYQN